MRIRDWSSDLCSSDLEARPDDVRQRHGGRQKVAPREHKNPLFASAPSGRGRDRVMPKSECAGRRRLPSPARWQLVPDRRSLDGEAGPAPGRVDRERPQPVGEGRRELTTGVPERAKLGTAAWRARVCPHLTHMEMSENYKET